MKIETLIGKLQEMQKKMPGAEIRLNDHHGDELLFIVALSKEHLQPCNQDIANVIWLEGEHDNDMGEEIQARFDNAIEEGLMN